MVAYATVGTNDPVRAVSFYDALLGPIGLGRMFDHPNGGAVYGKDGAFAFGVMRPFNGEAATVGNGSMAGFDLASRDAVDQFHAAVLALGGSCEGAPGPRGGDDSPHYFCYARDLDGNKLCAFKIG